MADEIAVAVPVWTREDLPAVTVVGDLIEPAMKPNGETNRSTNGPARASGNGLAATLRLAIPAFIVLAGSVLVIWAIHTTWQRLRMLQEEFAELRADSFYVGVRMRNEIQRLNDTLLRHRLRGDAADAESFLTDARGFARWLESSATNATTTLEAKLFSEVGAAFEDYYISSTNLLAATRGRLESTQAREFKVSYEKVQQQSLHLLHLCDSFISNQRATFDDFLTESNRTLTTFQWLLRLSMLLLLTLLTALAIFFYRGMIAPLRLRLTESHAIIARQEKLASLGVLAAGVAHEIRNPLTAIKFRLFSLKKSLPNDGGDNEDADVIGNEISRLERIVRDFLLFARPSDPELVAVPAQRVAQEVFDLMKPQLEKTGITVKLETPVPGWVRADTQQIKQVLINLVQNSAESIVRDGNITLRVADESGEVRLEVVDNGKGIPEEVQSRLFDPFFSTKEGGTGLGLAIAARIVEKHNGELRYQTHPNRGTTFTIALPRHQDHESQNPDH